MQALDRQKKRVAVIGGGPAGLMAAETLANAGYVVTVYERKPSPGRKFLMAGRGGLNLTHSEPLENFLTRYGAATQHLRPVIEQFSPAALRAWCEGLGQPTFIGSSGRIFPESFKASPLLRAWLARLQALGVTFIYDRQSNGWDENNALTFAGVTETMQADATLLALGGASWPRLGSDGGWFDILRKQDIPLAPLRPANCGFQVAWSETFRSRFAGQPVKPVRISFDGITVTGEIMIGANGVEGGAIYALSALLREAIANEGTAVPYLDLRPGQTVEQLSQRLAAPRGRQSFSSHLRKAGGLSPVAASLLREGRQDISALSPDTLAALIKNLPLSLTAPFAIDRAISTAGGVEFEALDENFMLRGKPGVFAAGEMLDWEAPTGGYLLQATFATGVAAAKGIAAWLK